MNSKFVTLDKTMEIEEETMPTHGLYYPVRIGEVFKSRYEVLSKLGYGANSTVWFCRDLQQVGTSINPRGYQILILIIVAKVRRPQGISILF